jgi:hypothetical protein
LAFFVEKKLLFVSGLLQAKNSNIQTSLGFNVEQWKGAQEKEADEKGGVDLVGWTRTSRIDGSSPLDSHSPKPPERLIRPAGGLKYAVQVIRSAERETVCSRNAVLRFYSHPY